jgi:hypothetical protein
MKLIENRHKNLQVWVWFDPERQITVCKYKKLPVGGLLTFHDRQPFKSDFPGIKGPANAKAAGSIGQARRIIHQVLGAELSTIEKGVSK